VNEDAAPQGHCGQLVARGRADLRAIDQETAIQILDCIDRSLSNRTGDVEKTQTAENRLSPASAGVCRFDLRDR
jgi:hypothetical protein